jgi:glycosyltransferase involved in cell wall biosynthesis
MRNKNDPKPNPKRLLYLGNKLSRKGKNTSTIEYLSNQFEGEGYKVVSASSQTNSVLRLLVMLGQLIVQASKTDVLLIDTYSTSAFWYAYVSSRLAFFLKLDYIPILHGGDLPKRLKSHPQFCQRLFGNAKVNVAPSAYLLQEFKNAGYTNLIYIPNTIKLDLYTFKKRQELQPQLLWVRSFAHLYNPLLALQVLKELRFTYPKVKLSMVGPFKDDSIEECKAFAKEHGLPVTFTGGMKKEDWLKYAQDFDVFINTTNVDNTPVSVIEAMALGLPVVSTNVGGLPYLLDHEKEALLVSPGHVDEFTQAIIRLLDDPSLAQQLSLQGRKKVEHFDWEEVKHQWFEVISGESK